MNVRINLATIAVLAVLLLVGCGESEGDSNSPEIRNSDSNPMVDGSYVLTNSDIDKYLTIMGEMQALGESLEGNPSMLEAFSVNGDVRSLLNKHNIKANKFAQIQAAITTAMGATLMTETAPMGKDSPFLKSLENSPGMTPEKLADIRSRMKETAAKAQSIASQAPESNIRLVKSRMEDLKNLGK